MAHSLENNINWIKNASEILGKIHYKQKEVELFFLKIGQERIYEDNRNHNQIVDYNRAMHSFATTQPSIEITRMKILSILTDLKWNEAVKKINLMTIQTFISDDDKANEIYFHKMVNVKNIERIKHYLDLGVDVNSKSVNGYIGLTALQSAAFNGYSDVLELILKYNPDVNLQCQPTFQQIDPEGCTALHLSIVNGHANCAKVLLNHGANINCQDLRGCSPLHFAAVLNCLDCAKILIENNADIEMRSHNQATALMYAAEAGSFEVFQYLVQQGASQIAIGKINSTLLHYAGKGGNLEIFKIAYEMNTNINAMNDDANTPITLAMEMGHTNIVQYCLQISAEIIIPKYQSPKQYAEKKGYTKIVALLTK